MKIGRTVTSALAAFGFAFLGHAALAGPAAEANASAVYKQTDAASQSTFTLIRRGFARAGGARGFRAAGFRGGAVAGRRGVVAGRRGFVAGRRGVVAGGRVVGGRRVVAGRRVGYWRNGRWIGPAVVGGVVAGAAGGSCYWNCRNSGHGPSFCRANAGGFC
jgi:hypothetical protein